MPNEGLTEGNYGWALDHCSWKSVPQGNSLGKKGIFVVVGTSMRAHEGVLMLAPQGARNGREVLVYIGVVIHRMDDSSH